MTNQQLRKTVESIIETIEQRMQILDEQRRIEGNTLRAVSLQAQCKSYEDALYIIREELAPSGCMKTRYDHYL